MRATVANAILLANIAVLVLLLASGTASAQNGIFDTILGRRAAPASSRGGAGERLCRSVLRLEPVRLARGRSRVSP